MEGLRGGRALPVPPPAPEWLQIRFPCGDQHPADRALGCLGEETEGWRHCYSIGLSKNTSQMLCLTVLSVDPCFVTDPSSRKRNGVYSLTFVLSWHKTCSYAWYEIAVPMVGKKACLQTYRPQKYLAPQLISTCVYKLAHTVNKNNTSRSEFNSKDCIFTKPFTVSSPIPCLWNYLNSLAHTWAVSLVAILSLWVQLPWATPFFVSFTRGGAWLLPLERSVPCYFNPLWDDLFNKCLSLFSCRPLCEQTEHVFCFPQIKESIREGATEKERDNWAIYGFILCRFPLSSSL